MGKNISYACSEATFYKQTKEPLPPPPEWKHNTNTCTINHILIYKSLSSNYTPLGKMCRSILQKEKKTPLQPLNVQFAFQLISTKTIKKTVQKEHRENISTQHKKVQNFICFGKRQPTHSNAAMQSNAAIQ